jgi:ACS family glucarate transporter-like MFS transporter
VKDTADPIPVIVSRPTHVRYLVLAALCAITTINYIQRNSLGGAETTVRADLGLTRNDTGDAMGAFFLTYALCQVPSGWLAQRWGGRRALTVYAAGWSIVMAFTAMAANLPALLGARWAMGALQAGIFPCCTMILAAWYPVTRRGFASAILNSFMLIGGVLASWMTAKLIGSLGWRSLFLLYSLPGLMWACWFAVWFRNRPRDHAAVNAAELAIISPDYGLEKESAICKPESAISRKVPWVAIFLSSALWLICIQQFCRAGALRFFDQWLPTYLQEARGQSVEDANYWTSLPLLAGMIGGPVGGILSDFVLARTRSRRAARQGVAIGGLLAGLLLYGLAYQVSNLTGTVLVACLGLFIMTFSSPCSYALTMDMGGRNLGVIFATMNMAGNLGSWAFTKFIPRIVTWRGWESALLVFAVLHVVAIVCWLLLNPNGLIGEPTDAESVSKE